MMLLIFFSLYTMSYVNVMIDPAICRSNITKIYYGLIQFII